MAKTENKIKNIYDLTPMQEGMLFHSLLDDESGTYYEQSDITLKGSVNIQLFEKAFNQLLERHDILRTVFLYKKVQKPRQVVLRERQTTILFEDLTQRNDKGNYIEKFAKNERIKGFDLSRDVLIKVSVFQTETDEYRVLWSFHHILMDGWCMGIILSEFFQLYDALLQNKQVTLPPVYPYASYLKWLDTRNTQATTEYWKNYLTGFEELTSIPKSKLLSNNHIKETIHAEIAGERFQKFTQHCSQNGMTINNAFQTLWGVMLQLYNHTDDVCFGSVVSGRPAEIPNVESILGLFINTVPTRMKCTGNEQLLSVMRQLQQSNAETGKQDYFPLADIQKNASVNGTLFDHILVFENFAKTTNPENITSSTLGFSVTSMKHFEQTNYGLNVVVNPSESELTIHIDFNKEQYESESISKALNRFQILVDKFIENPHIRIAELNFTDSKEENLLLNEWNNTDQQLGQAESVMNLIGLTVENFPENKALLFGEKTISYGELNTLSDKFAAVLCNNYQIKKGDIVAIQASRSEKLIIAILGILKSGAAYLPIDPGTPKERCSFVLSDANVSLLVSDKTDEFDIPVLNPDNEWTTIVNIEPLSILPKIEPEDTAYIIYTSGSTGLPKGCVLSHANLCHYIKWANSAYFEGIKGDFPLYTSISFDLTITSIFSTLSRGAVLTIHNQEEEINQTLTTIFTSGESDIVKITPAHIGILKHLEIKSDKIKAAIVGGEQLTLEQVSILRKINPEVKIFNEYGPTEATVGCVVKEIEINPKSIEIGKPIANMKAYILNRHAKPTAIGIPGELFLAGKGVASGYLNRAELTSERFIELPEISDQKLYKTGDLAYWNESGELVYLNRVDNQLKLRGYRVEPGEIEQVILAIEGIKETVVLEKNEVLAAYFTADNQLDRSALKTILANQLPEYMLPQFLSQLDQMPLTTNGKIDKNKLPDPTGSLHEFIAPQSETEKKLAHLWSEILGIEQVGINDNFFELGGHSLKLTILYSLIIKHFEKEIRIKELFTTPVLKNQAKLIDGGSGSNQLMIERAAIQTSYPLSFAQKRLFILNSLDEESTAYNIPVLLKINGKIDIDKIKTSIITLVNRHEIFRTCIHMENGEAVQKIAESVELDFDFNTNCASIENELKHFVKPFDLGKAPLFRVKIIQLSTEEYILGLDMHHIISDGFSSGLFVNEFTKLYNNEPLKDLSIQYKDYAVWQQKFSVSEKFLQQKNYWLNKFTTLPEPLELPFTQGSRPTEQMFEGDSLNFEFNNELTQKIKSAADKQGVSVFMYLLTCFKILLYKYSSQEDIVVGTPVSGRTQAQMNEIIGVFINTLALRTKIDPKKSFNETLSAVKEEVLNGLENQDYPFESLIEELNISPDLSRNPLFDVMFIFQNQNDVTLELGGAKIAALEVENRTSKFDLSLEIVETSEKLIVNFEYATSLFNTAFIQKFFSHFTQLIHTTLTGTDPSIAEVSMLSEDEKTNLLSINSGNLDYSFSSDTLVSLFEQQLELTPEKTALICANRAFSYQELNTKANIIAEALVQKGVKPDDIVAIKMPRGFEFVVAMLGIMKAGGAYVSVDINYPESRQNHIISDSKAKLIIATDDFETTTEIILFESFDFTEQVTNINRAINNGLAYIIYTSGSTGLPKGVAIEHRNAVSFIAWCKNEFSNDEYETVLAGTSFSFDLSIFELFFHFSIGKRVVLLENGLEIPDNLTKYDKILLNTVPSVINDLLNMNLDFSKVSAINMAGETIPQTVKNKLDYRKIKVRNLYGPSEDTTYSTCYELTTNDAKQIIGKPIDGTKAYVLDSNLQLLPKGVHGELYLSGSNIARGYLYKPELTAERFLPNSFKPGEKLYKTGDVVKWTDDWNLEYLGRADDQVKIRGFRIELGEIESLMSLFSGMAELCVIAKNSSIYAYFTASNSVSQDDLRSFLSKSLPEYMVPSYFVQLEKMPLTPNGKIDKNKLPEPQMSSEIHAKRCPETQLEKELATIWKSVLNCDEIFIDDNFFQIGGHSLKATQIVFRIKSELNLQLGLKDFFKNPSIEKLSLFLSKSAGEVIQASIQKAPKAEFYKLSHQQKRLWVAEQIQDTGSTFNMPDAYWMNGNLDVSLFKQSFSKLIENHEILRTVFVDLDGEPRQKVLDVSSFDLKTLDIQDEKQIQEKVNEFASQRFNLESGPLFSGCLLKINDQTQVFVLNMHHIISDGWSMKVLMNEVIANYSALSLNQESVTEKREIQYKDYAHHQLENLSEVDENYWLDKLKGGFEPVALPFDFKKIENKPSISKYEHFITDKETYESLMGFSKTQQTSLSNVVFAVFNVLLSQLTGQKEVAVGITSANRNYPETEKLIGFFINTLIIKTDLNGDLAFEDLLKEVIRNVSDALEHQDYPVDLLLDKLKRRDTVNVAYSFQSFNKIELTEKDGHDYSLPIEVKPFEIEVQNAASKYDLLLLVNETNEGLRLELEYDGTVFKPETAKRILNYLNKFLIMVAEPKKEEI